MTTAIRTFEAVYEKGYLRPLAPLEGREGLVYIVTVVDINAIGRKPLSAQSIRGKYRGRLSSSDEFARNKQNEKALGLAKHLNARVVSTDHHEFDVVEKPGEVQFFWLR